MGDCAGKRGTVAVDRTGIGTRGTLDDALIATAEKVLGSWATVGIEGAGIGANTRDLKRTDPELLEAETYEPPPR